MAKKLVSEKGVEALVIGENFYMDGTVILTPGAKDVLRDKGVTIVYGQKPETCEPETCDKDKLEVTVAALLKNDYGVTEEAQVKAFSSLVTQMMKNA